MPIVTVKLFPPEVDSLEHPLVEQMRGMLTAMAADYGTAIKTFAIARGVVLFSVESERMAADFCEFVAESTGCQAEVAAEEDAFLKRSKGLIDGAKG